MHKPRLSAQPFSGAVLSALRSWLVLALVLGGFSLNGRFRETFWTADYLPNILQQAATNIILAVGMTTVILTGGIDLSVGSVLALCSVALGLTVTKGPPDFLTYFMALPVAALLVALWIAKRPPRSHRERAIAGAALILLTALGGWLIQRGTAGGVRLEGAVLAALMVGVGCGLLNGLLVSLGRVPSFVVTLGMYTAARGLTTYATGGNSVSGLPPRLALLGSWEKGAVLAAIALTVVVVGSLLQTRTQAGRYLSAIGANEEASRLAGLNVTLYKTLAYVLAGATAAIAAFVYTAKFALADTNAGTGAELSAIAAVVIGGTSLSGGRGSVVGSLVGALTIAVLNAGLVLVGVPDTLQGVIIGVVIVLAVMVDQLQKPAR